MIARRIKAAIFPFVLITAIPSSVLASVSAQEPPESAARLASEVRARIVRLIEERKVPSLSLAVVKDGEIVWEEAFGLADLEKKIKATRETIYPVASVTKPFTAAAAMTLVERGLLDLDKPANTYLGQAKLRAFEGDASGATVRRILQHTSGLPMHWNFYYAGTPRKRPPLETTLGRYGILVDPPGSNYNYSNLGYAVLEDIIERVSGKSYAEFLRDEVFGPLGMARTSVATDSPPEGAVAGKYSSATAPVPFCDHDTRGASSIYSTARDLAIFSLFHLGRLRPDQKAILTSRSIAVLRSSRDAGVRTSSYALGMETGTRFGFPILTHGGAMDGCRAHLAMIPSQGLAVGVLANGENVRTIEVCDWVFAALLPAYARNMKDAAPQSGSPPQAPPFRPPSELVGTWEGKIKTHESEVPVRLTVEKSGTVELSPLDPIGSPMKRLSPLKPPTLGRGVFVVHFPQAFSLTDAPAADHRTVLGLTIRSDRLSGEASLIAADMSYSLPSFIELKRDSK